VERNLEFGNHLTLSGHVEYDGEPLPEARVSVRASHLTLKRSVVTDHDGGFRIEDLEPDTYWLGVSHSRELLIHNDTLEISGDRDVVIRLRAGALEGQVADAATKKPIGTAAVQLFPTEGPEFTVAGSADKSGRFRLPRVPPGRFRLRVQADGYSPREQTVEVPAGPAGPPVEVSLEPAPGLELRVRLASGGIPSLVDLRVTTLSGSTQTERRRVDGDGRARFTTLPAGTWQLALGASGGGLVRIMATVPGPPVDVTFPNAAPLHVQVPALAESNLLGEVALYDFAGKPLEVMAMTGQLETREPVIGGLATIPAVPAGTWNVRVDAPDGRQWRAVAITDGRGEAVVQME
jgi:hypothetical protein